ncbi:MAG: hypothetical protein EA361_05010 [Bacteroidetes bacterium]|nr:MAG: hypothetical protein EA361_05010 [Bacteroidota bacterium]
MPVKSSFYRSGKFLAILVVLLCVNLLVFYFFSLPGDAEPEPEFIRREVVVQQPAPAKPQPEPEPEPLQQLTPNLALMNSSAWNTYVKSPVPSRDDYGNHPASISMGGYYAARGDKVYGVFPKSGDIYGAEQFGRLTMPGMDIEYLETPVPGKKIYLNVGEEHLYFISRGNIMSWDLHTGDTAALFPHIEATKLILYREILYFTDAERVLYRAVPGEDAEVLLPGEQVRNFSISEQLLAFLRPGGEIMLMSLEDEQVLTTSLVAQKGRLYLYGNLLLYDSYSNSGGAFLPDPDSFVSDTSGNFVHDSDQCALFSHDSLHVILMPLNFHQIPLIINGRVTFPKTNSWCGFIYLTFDAEQTDRLVYSDFPGSSTYSSDDYYYVNTMFAIWDRVLLDLDYEFFATGFWRDNERITHYENNTSMEDLGVECSAPSFRLYDNNNIYCYERDAFFTVTGKDRFSMISGTDTTVYVLPYTPWMLSLKALYGNSVLLECESPEVGGLTTPHTYLLYCMETQTLNNSFPIMAHIIEVCREGIYMETVEDGRRILPME